MSAGFIPFREIALCLSGGGYRAAGFHLGLLNYLNNIEVSDGTMLTRVKAISTVSGGTIIGAYYALSDAQGKSFIDFFKEFRTFLIEHDLVKESFEKLSGKKKWIHATKNPNLINAFAEIYDQLLTEGHSMKSISESSLGHLSLCAFNTTEFRHGINFRFQSEKVKGAPYKRLKRGNHYLPIAYDVQCEIRISDIIAASSCFPGGFEPMKFPHDFCGEDTPLLKGLKGRTDYKEGIGIMDGGIYDNQGIDSIRISEKRRASRQLEHASDEEKERLPYDLLIISDVSSPDIIHPFQFHKTQDRKISHYSYDHLIQWANKIKALWLWIAVLMSLGGLMMALINGWEDNIVTGVSMMIFLIGIVIIGLRMVVSRRLYYWHKEATEFLANSIDDFYLKKVSSLDFRKYKLSDLEPLVMDRFNSVSLMVQDLFLKQVRRLKYNSIYEDPIYEHRRMASLIKLLKEDDWDKTSEYQKYDDIDVLLKGSYREVMGDLIPLIIDEASSFGTTLWFTEEDKWKEISDKLIVTGQLTMCFNLMTYVEEIKNTGIWRKLSEDNKSEIMQVFTQCKKDWVQLKKDPYSLLNQALINQ